MRKCFYNNYERAFVNWLIDNRLRYVVVDEQKRAAFGRSKIKSFDYLLYPVNQKVILAEVKGRKFKGSSFANLAGFECWVTTEDIDGLARWEQILGEGHIGAFIFAYGIENVDVDFDGRDIYVFDGGKYVFFCITLNDYMRFMKVRSPKWRTVTLPADKFRQCVMDIRSILANIDE